MKQIPFNLQRALAGDKVVTRDGREVTQLTKFDANDDEYPLIGVLQGRMRSWCINGKLFRDGRLAEGDLFMAPKTVKRWVNFYAEGGVVDFDTELLAKINGQYSSGAIAIAVPVEFEEGYGCE